MNSNKFKTIKKCRVCDSPDLVAILNMGDQPLANSLKKSATAAEDKFPLTIVFCQRCSLVQLKETIDKEALFDNYVWVTGTSATARKYADTFCERTIRVTGAKPGDLIIEIASNDGTFLKPFVKRGFKVVGIDPAKNIVDMAQKNGVETIGEYWNPDTASEIISNYDKAKVVIARNVIPHVSELHEVIAGIQSSLTEDGVSVIEFHYAGTILDELHYDSIYHEHLCYFSIKSMEYLLARHGLFPFHIDLSPISGGSFVIYSSKKKRETSNDYTELLNKENKLLLNDLKSWREFADKCREHRQRSREMLGLFSDRTVLGFGSSARSSTYLNFCGFNRSQIKAIIDNNKLKQGLYSAGSSLPIISFEDGLKMSPDLLFVLAWNFKNEIVEECKVKGGYKGDFLVPFPKEPYLLKKQSLKRS